MRRIRIAILSAFLFFSFTTVYGQGVWRWDVKVITDEGASNLVGVNSPISTTIEAQVQMTPFKKLSTSSGDVGRDKSEDTVYTLSGYLIGYKYEGGSNGDNDYHIVLQDKNTGATIVAEIPDNEIEPASGSDYASEYGNALESFEQLLERHGLKVKSQKFVGDVETPEFQIPVVVTGVGFWDLPGHMNKKTGKMVGHGKGSAINGREIHPIFSIKEEGIPDNVAFASTSVARANNTPNRNSPTDNTTMASITPEHALAYMLLAAVLGIAGQVFRLIVGMKKSRDANPTTKTSDLFSGKQFLIGLSIAGIVGAVAGVLAAVTTKNYDVTQSTYFAFIAAGYAGTDFIEGFVIKK